ncbi:protein translocase SecDF, variant type [Spiroplasma sp. DGKH1]|uniref:protein translocase SecDF, variant type n=1 Tax=Spiroplasma sp. DGKH1 TaxID=3050074 RepID=UPI0034C6190B
MKEKQQVKTIKKPVNRKVLTKLIVRIFVLLILTCAMIVGAVFSGENFSYSYKLGIAYSGGYQVQINVFDTTVENPDGSPNGDNKKGLDLLRNKLDPLNNTNLYLQTLGHNGLELIAGKDLFKSYADLKTDIQRLGAIYLMKGDGTDLLVSDKERTPLSDVISGAEAGIDKTRHPIINLNIKDQAKWDAIIKSLTPSQGSPEPLYIWTDLGQFIDELRHDTDNIQAIATNFNVNILPNLNGTDILNVRSIFDVSYKDEGQGGIIVYRNLLDLATSGMSHPELVKLMQEDSFRFTTVSLDKLVIDPNDKKAIKNQYIDPLRKYLTGIVNYTPQIKDKYKKYIINYNAINKGTTPGLNSNQIATSTDTEARTISNLVNGGLSGLKFVVRGHTTIPPVVSRNILNVSMIVLGIIAAAICVYLLIYYRLFGFVAILTLAFTIILTLYFSSLLGVQISPESITAVIIAFGIALEGNLLLFSRYKRERYQNGLPYEPAMKIANKQTVAVFVDALVVLLVLGLSLFWAGTNNIKSFATILLVALIISLVMVFAVARIMYWIIIKLRWQEKVTWLDIPRFSLLTYFQQKKHPHQVVNGEGQLLSESFFALPTSDVNETTASVEGQPKKPHKLRFKPKFSLYNITKYSPIVGIILIIIALIIGFAGKANIDSTIKPGTNITVASDIWRHRDDAAAEIQEMTQELKHLQATRGYNFSFNLYVIKADDMSMGQQLLVISTNISGSNFARELLSSIAGYYGLTPEDPVFNLEKTSPVMETYILKTAGISLAIGIACIFVYTLFRLDWAQFIGILCAAVFTLAVSVSIVVIAHILLTFEMSIAFIAIFGFAWAMGAIVMARAKQNKKLVNIKEYETFFTYMSEHRAQVRRLRRAKKVYMQEEIKKLMVANPNLKQKEVKKEFAEHLKTQWKIAQDLAAKNKKEIKLINKEFRNYNYTHNFLQKIANLTIKQMLRHCLTLGAIFAIILIILAAFSGSVFGFNITVFIGLAIGMFSVLFLAIPIWVALEKYRALNKIRVKNYLDSQRVEIDEQIVAGVND